MDDRGGGGGSFVAVRRISQGLDRGTACHSTSAEAVAGSAAWLGRGLSCVCAQRRDSDARASFDLTPGQEECLERLQNRLDVAYDSSIPEHQEALWALWHAAFPGEELHGLISEQWKEMGWQGKDPSTDFRGGVSYLWKICCTSLGIFRFFVFKVQFLIAQYMDLHQCFWLHAFGSYFGTIMKSFQELLWKQEGDRSLWEYPFAVAGVNITFMLIQMLDLEAVKPRTLVGATFLKFLAENESAFDLLYCISFKLLDHEWLAMRASYMDFNAVMKATRRQLETELLQEDITCLEELPSYGLLSR
ncbi:ELMO domain-containing protein A [Sesamum angolense]|uniref:ELMO domain-containing protein A n=1 Tax=Sesamum angolense TaxID=2727404 RepID=A0AAE2BTN9_9LAMI|nr:ELMO domain-containing protein A [Sesamum angolense]